MAKNDTSRKLKLFSCMDSGGNYPNVSTSKEEVKKTNTNKYGSNKTMMIVGVIPM